MALRLSALGGEPRGPSCSASATRATASNWGDTAGGLTTITSDAFPCAILIGGADLHMSAAIRRLRGASPPSPPGWKLDPNSGLLVPVAFETLAQTRPSSTSFVAITLGYHEIFGPRMTWEDLATRLRKYTRATVLNLIGRVSFVLDRSGAPESRDVQEQLIYTIFGVEGRHVWEHFVAAVKKEGPLVAVFHEAQLLALAKASYLIEDIGADALESTYELGEALLIVTDLIDVEARALTGKGHETREGNQGWQRYLLANILFNSGGAMVHELARCYDLYLTDKPDLSGHESYINLPERAERVTGLPVDVMWMALMAIAARWLAYDADAFLREDVRIQFSSYFSAGFDFTADEIDRFFSLMAADDSEIRRAIVQTYTGTALQPFNPMPFARYPVVRFGDWGLPVSAPLLRERFTKGLHHIFLDDQSLLPAERERYLRYMGVVFEDYVHRLLSRALGGDGSRYIGGSLLRASASGKACDGAVRYADSVVLLETKASVFPLRARIGRDWAGYERVVRDAVVDGAEQIFETIASIGRGELRGLGLDPKEIRHCCPLVITLDTFPVHPLIMRTVADELRDRGLDPDEAATPVQIMNVGELEIVEKALGQGRSLLDLVTEKATVSDGVGMSFRNFWFARNEAFLRDGPNDYLAGVYRNSGARAQATLSARTRK